LFITALEYLGKQHFT